MRLRKTNPDSYLPLIFLPVSWATKVNPAKDAGLSACAFFP